MKFLLIFLLLGSPSYADRYTITQGIASGQLEIRDAQGRVVSVTQRTITGQIVWVTTDGRRLDIGQIPVVNCPRNC